MKSPESELSVSPTEFDPTKEISESGLQGSRREFLRHVTLGSLASVELLKGRILYGSLTASGSRYRIGVCDWMLLQRQTLRAISLAAELGAQGLEVDMGPLGQRETFQNALADPDFRASFLETARQHNITLCSLAMSAFYAQSFVERPSVPRMVEDALQTAMALGIRVLFLPLGVPCDLVARPELRPSVVARLREIAGAVEAARVVLGIETSLPAAEEIQLLDEVGSAAVRSYFNFAQAMKHRRNLITELETLGAQRLIQIHASNEDGLRLPEDPSLDLPRIKQTLDRMGWSGWLVVERSRDARKPRDLHHNYATNIGWLKQIFQRSSEAS